MVARLTPDQKVACSNQKPIIHLILFSVNGNVDIKMEEKLVCFSVKFCCSINIFNKINFKKSHGTHTQTDKPHTTFFKVMMTPT